VVAAGSAWAIRPWEAISVAGLPLVSVIVIGWVGDRRRQQKIDRRIKQRYKTW
jgi:hypothetical protein